MLQDEFPNWVAMLGSRCLRVAHSRLVAYFEKPCAAQFGCPCRNRLKVANHEVVLLNGGIEDVCHELNPAVLPKGLKVTESAMTVVLE